MREQTSSQERFMDLLKLALAAFLILSPWVFGFAAATLAAGNAWTSGAAIGLASIAGLTVLMEWEEWVSLALGLWVLISPWVLGFHATALAAMRINVVVGIAIALFAAVELWLMYRNPPHVTA